MGEDVHVRRLFAHQKTHFWMSRLLWVATQSLKATLPDRLLPPLVVLSNLHVQPLDFLVQGGERDVEAVSGLGLVPVALLQHVANDAALAVFDDLEQRGVRRMVYDGELAARPVYQPGLATA